MTNLPTIYSGTATFDDFSANDDPKRVFFTRLQPGWLIWSTRGVSMWVCGEDTAKRELNLTADRNDDGTPVTVAPVAAVFKRLSYIAGEYDYLDIVRHADRWYEDAAAEASARTAAEQHTYFVVADSLRGYERVVNEFALREDAERHAAGHGPSKGWQGAEVVAVSKGDEETLDQFRARLDDWLDAVSDYAAIANGEK